VRAHLSVVSRALGLLPPPGSVYTNVSNEQGLIESTTHLKSLGFFGRNVIHPNQIAPVNQIFTPQPEEIQAAEELFTEVARQATQGATAFVRTDGSFIDPALVRNARRTIDVSEQIQSSTAPKGA
jgi:citrate lyase subunit beta/citryl-CoA lyase